MLVISACVSPWLSGVTQDEYQKAKLHTSGIYSKVMNTAQVQHGIQIFV